jgi:hypothetical protein
MGERANFGMRQEDGNIIFVYGHWAGVNMLTSFAYALSSANDRLPHDAAYATRITISQLVGSDWSQNLGWGITINTFADNEYPVPVYDFGTDTIAIYDYSSYTNTITEPIEELTRKDFINKYAPQLVEA